MLHRNSHIRPEMVNLQMWNETSLQALRKWKIRVINLTTKQKFKVDFVIVDKELTPLLSGKAANLTVAEEGALTVIRCTCTLPESCKGAVKAEFQSLADTDIIKCP